MDTLTRYFLDIAATEPLSSQEEAELSRRIHEGDYQARDRLVRANLWFVVKIAREYWSGGLPLADLIGAGNLGLVVAAERFDGTRGIRFITYAGWWVRNHMLQAIAEHTWVIRLPTNRIVLLLDLARCANDHAPLGVDARARLANASDEMVRDTLALARDMLSLDAHSPDSRGLMETLPDMEQVPPDGFLEAESVCEQVRKVIASLDAREVEVLWLHYGLDGGAPMTLAEVGRRIDLSRERVRQIKTRALDRLRRHPLRALLEGLL